MKAKPLKLILLLAVAIGCTAIVSRGQSCDLTVTAFVSSSHDGVTLRRTSDDALDLVTVTVVSDRTRRSVAGVIVGPGTTFEDLRSGTYKITLRRASYETAVYNYSHFCDTADVASFRIWPGNPRTVALHPVATERPSLRMERVTVIGSVDPGPDASPPASAEVPPVRLSPPRTISGGVLNGKATSLPKPQYPPAARAAKAAGVVVVQVTIDESGRVISASAVSGHPLLREAAVSSAREARFPPTLLSGQPVKVTGVITYNFVP